PVRAANSGSSGTRGGGANRDAASTSAPSATSGVSVSNVHVANWTTFRQTLAGTYSVPTAPYPASTAEPYACRLNHATPATAGAGPSAPPHAAPPTPTRPARRPPRPTTAR